MFQSVVAPQIGFGVPGELAFEGPLRANAAILATADPALNVVGRGCSIVSGAGHSWLAGSAGAADPKPIIAEVGGNGPFAGILANPKVYPLYGTAAGGPLADSMTVPNGIAVELVIEGDIVVILPPCNPGDLVYFDATGVIVTTPHGAAAPAGSVGPIGSVDRYAVVGGAGLGVIHVTSNSPLADANAV